MLVLAIADPRPSFAATDWRTVPAKEVASTFAGSELADGVHYSYQFRRDGTFTGVEMGRNVKGRWLARGNEFCWTWIKPKGEEECMTVHRRAHDIQLSRDGALFLEGTLSKPGR
jgi:hypothetical protein